MADIKLPYSIFYTNYLSKHLLDEDNNAITLQESKETYAKKVYSHSGTKYYILSQNNTIVNPFDIYGYKKTKSLFDNKELKFIKVSQKIFDMYVKFLNSQNLSLLYNVQREALI
jgi:hypothetical protein